MNNGDKKLVHFVSHPEQAAKSRCGKSAAKMDVSVNYTKVTCKACLRCMSARTTKWYL